MTKSIDIIISTILKRTGIDAAMKGLKDFAAAAGRNLTNIKSAFDMAAAVAARFYSAMQKGMEFERMTVQFKSLTGSLELAKAHMKDLQDLGRTPPFSLEEFAAASQAMLKMTGGALGYKDVLEKVGDIAAATGNNLATMGQAVGRAYAFIRDGAPIMTAVEQLRTMGVVTQADVAAMTELQEAGADNAALWSVVEGALKKYNGAMAETEKTTKGLVEAVQGEATVAMTEFSTAISESAKPALEGLLGALKRINEDGTIESWADSTVGAIGKVVSAVKTVGGWIDQYLIKPFRDQDEFIAEMNDIGTSRELIEETKTNAWTTRRAFRNSDGTETYEYEEDLALKKKIAREEKASKAKAEAEKRQQEDLAAAQVELDRKNAEEAAKKEAEAAKNAEAEWIKAVEAEQKAREKMEADLHKQRLDDLNAEIKASQNAAAATQGTISAAQTEFDKAFAMYRSEDKGAAAIAEERDYAADYKRLQKDAARYGGKWRIDELASLIAAGDTQGQAATLEEWRKSKSFTPEVESMVRAAAADQTRTTAEDELRQINANTAKLDEKLDQLLAMK